MPPASPSVRKVPTSTSSRLTADLRRELALARSGLLDLLRQERPDPDRLSPGLREEYEGRASIVEAYDEMTRPEAERFDWWIVVAKFERIRPTQGPS